MYLINIHFFVFKFIMITLEQMLNSSVHLGHHVQKWNPKMAPYIYGERNGIHIIDLLQTLICLEKACRFLSKTSKGGKELDLIFTVSYVF